MYNDGSTPAAAGSSQQYAQPPVQQPNMVQQAVSSFDGSVLECFCACLVSGLIMGFTLGIATPWAVCYLYKFILTHVCIDGTRLTFDGTGAQLFGNWIKWFLLCIITIGIYGFWVMPKMLNWVAKHTHVMRY